MHSNKPTTFATGAPTSSARVLLVVLLALLALGSAIYFFGPRNDFGPSMPSARPIPPQDINAVEDWIKASEAAYPDIKPGNAKGIVWAAAPNTRTKWSVIYIHGFSASRLETAPLAETVASQLGANLFYTRLSGHGRTDGTAMGEATAQDWMADVLEAALVGQTLGERVLFISCSTGATLSTWLGISSDAGRVAAHIFISPNFGLRNKRAAIVNAPWGQKLALWLEGPTRSWTPDSTQEANAWTSSYPTKAIFPMMALLKKVRASDLSLFQTPVLVLYSESDETVDPAEIQAAFTRLGSARKSIDPIAYSQSKGQHVLAGAIKDPTAVTPMAETMVQWVKSLPREPS